MNSNDQQIQVYLLTTKVFGLTRQKVKYIQKEHEFNGGNFFSKTGTKK